MREKSFQKTTATRRAFLGMSVAALPFSALAARPETTWERTARWLHTGRIGALRNIYVVLPHTDAASLQQHAEGQLQEMLHALNLPAPCRQKNFHTQKTCMLLVQFPNHLEATLHLSPTPPPGPEISLHGTAGRIEISHGIARLYPLA